jgi:hypothetical protein
MFGGVERKIGECTIKGFFNEAKDLFRKTAVIGNVVRAVLLVFM